jgi:hypothetical protein
MLFVGMNFARPLAKSAMQEKGRALVVSVILVVMAVAAIVAAHLPVALIVIAALALGGALFPIRAASVSAEGQGDRR